MTSTSSTPDATARDSQVTLAELVGAFSLTTDLGLGQPLEHVLRSWVIAARLGDHVGLEPTERDALYYVATLAWVDWFNHRRLLEPIGYVPPAEYEAQYYAQLDDTSTVHPDSRRGARRHPHADDSSHGEAAEHPHDVLRRVDTEIIEQRPQSH